MPKDLSYKDERMKRYVSDFADVVPSKIPFEPKKGTNASGRELDSVSIRELMTTIKLLTDRLHTCRTGTQVHSRTTRIYLQEWCGSIPR